MTARPKTAQGGSLEDDRRRGEAARREQVGDRRACKFFQIIGIRATLLLRRTSKAASEGVRRPRIDRTTIRPLTRHKSLISHNLA